MARLKLAKSQIRCLKDTHKAELQSLKQRLECSKIKTEHWKTFAKEKEKVFEEVLAKLQKELSKA